MLNLFGEAIEKDELLKFALGHEKYFVIDREFGEHSVIVSWINYILPLIEIKGIEYVSSGIAKMLNELTLASNIDTCQQAEILLYQLHTYYYLISEGRINYPDLEHINVKMENLLNSYYMELKKTNSSKSSAMKSAIHLIKARGGFPPL